MSTDNKREIKLEKLLNDKLGIIKDKKGNLYKDHIHWKKFISEQKKLLNEYIEKDLSDLNKDDVNSLIKKDRKNQKQRLVRLRQSISENGIRKNIKKICQDSAHIRADIYHYDAIPLVGRYSKFRGKICAYLLSAIKKNDVDAILKGIDSGIKILTASNASGFIF